MLHGARLRYWYSLHLRLGKAMLQGARSCWEHWKGGVDGNVTLHLSTGEYFCGAGGLAAGARLAARTLRSQDVPIEISPRWAVDINSAALRTYRRNFPEVNPVKVIEADVHDIDPHQLAAIDGFLFGFPCNDFSIVGKQKGTNGKYGPLYEEAVEVLNVKQPSWFVAENVNGIRSANEGKAFERILAAFVNAGYDIFPNLYKFEEYGVAQTRHRVLVIGLRQDLNLRFHIPAPTHPNPENYVTASEALADIPQDAANNELPKISARVRERLSHIKPGQNAFNADIPEELQLHVKGATLSHIYRKLEPDKPSYTLTAQGGGGTHGYHWAENRSLTNRERARIQGFRDDFVFEGTITEVRSQIGMAVPPLGAAPIFTALFKTLLGISYESVPANLESTVRLAREECVQQSIDVADYFGLATNAQPQPARYDCLPLS